VADDYDPDVIDEIPLTIAPEFIANRRNAAKVRIPRSDLARANRNPPDLFAARCIVRNFIPEELLPTARVCFLSSEDRFKATDSPAKRR
jgi:hypothetical protein